MQSLSGNARPYLNIDRIGQNNVLLLLLLLLISKAHQGQHANVHYKSQIV